MKHLKKFETTAAFENFTLDGNNTPNVSLIKELLNNTGGSIVYTKKILPHDYSLDYFTLVAIDDCEFGFITDCVDEGDGLSYSLDNGKTWSEYMVRTYDYDSGEQYISVSAGNKILFKGHNFDVSYNASCAQSPVFYEDHYNYLDEGRRRFNVEGNIMSLLYGDNFIGQTEIDFNKPTTFGFLFTRNMGLVNAENLILPATTLSNYCYQSMFMGCTTLITAPKLLAETLSVGCYSGMFYECESLNSITCLGINTNQDDCTYNWLYGVSDTGTFIKNASATWESGDSGIPSGWTVQNAE